MKPGMIKQFVFDDQNDLSEIDDEINNFLFDKELVDIKVVRIPLDNGSMNMLYIVIYKVK